jgi:hypothetical protein
MDALAKQLEGEGETKPPLPMTAIRAFATWAVVLSVAISGAAALFLILRVFYFNQALFEKLITEHVRAIVGIPMASCSAFCVLLFFEARSGNVEFSGLGFSFKGGAGPAVIWVFAFLAFTGAIRILW